MKTYLNAYLEDHKEEILHVLSDFVAIPSVSSDKEKVKEALEFALALGDQMGFRTENCLDGQVGVIEMGDGEETLGILSHVDVVPAGDREDWDSDPYETVIKDGRIYGRGTVDDKGMIVASLYGMKAAADYAKEKGLPVHKKVQLILGTQEEVEWTDMDAYVANYPLPDYGFSPDGEYPICNVEKGTADFTLEFDVTDEAVEEGAIYVTAVDCGVAKNAVPGKAIATLSNGETVTAVGKAVHSCQPERGVNALFVLCEMLQEKGVAKNKLMELIEDVTASFADVYGKAIGMYSESEYYQGEFVHRNAFSPTMFHAEDGTAVMNVNNRFAYGASEQELYDGMCRYAEGHGGRVTEWHAMPAVFVSAESPFLKILAEAYENVSGLKNEFTLAYGGSYAKAMPNVVSWGPLFPGEEDTCHEVNEYIDIKSMMDSAKIFAQSVAGIVLTEESLK
ncbi:MAG: Sapep family Mn(2+)-dependent dipeptidase [Firmicutes bacterium]|nr:Sapep family Mn(2+)-dependent dipeptidase [Bacillota bacterium]